MAAYFSQDTTVIFQFNLKEKYNNLKLDRLKFVWKIPFPSIPKNKYIYMEELIDLSRRIHELLQLVDRWNVN